MYDFVSVFGGSVGLIEDTISFIFVIVALVVTVCNLTPYVLLYTKNLWSFPNDGYYE